MNTTDARAQIANRRPLSSEKLGTQNTERPLDRLLKISRGKSVRRNSIDNTNVTWAQFVEELRVPKRTNETISSYLAMPRDDQDRIKDVGHYVPGHFTGSVRKRAGLHTRDLVTLDLDHAPRSFAVSLRVNLRGSAWVLHSTHKHHEDSPRLRPIVLLSRPVGPDEYGALSRAVAARVGMAYCDRTTFDWARVMHFPSVASDGEYVFEINDGNPLDVDHWLEREYIDWQDVSEWPEPAGQTGSIASERKAADPRAKPGTIGAFCRSYTIEEAISQFLPGAYSPGHTEDRLTYSQGSTSNGAVVYDGGRFLFSHHESDPAGGRLVNAFDMVRLHRFGHLDEGAESTVHTRLPSYAKMCELAKADARTRSQLSAADFPSDFDEVQASIEPVSSQVRSTDIEQRSTASDLRNVAKPVQAEMSAHGEHVLFLPGDLLPATAAADRIFRVMGEEPELFRRGDAVVELSDSKSLNVVSPTAFRSRMNQRGRVVRAIKLNAKSQNVYSETKQCSDDAARLLLGCLEINRLPEISLVSRMPVLSIVDGRLVTSQTGFNRSTGVLVLGKTTVPVVAPEAAASALSELLEDFHFLEPGDRARALASLIAPALRMSRLVDEANALMTCVEANQSQAGKGFFFEIVKALYGEEAYSVTLKKDGVGGFDESVGAAILSGLPLVQIDNVRGAIRSQFLESVLTARGAPVAVRVPHRAEVSVTVDRALFWLTSNGAEATADLANRMLLIRILKRPAGFKFRAYPEGGVRQHIAHNRAYLLGAVHSIVRTWYAAGRPREPSSHSFHEWCGTLDWIVRHVWKTVPLLEGHGAAVSRVSDPGLSWFRQIAERIVADGLSPTDPVCEFDEPDTKDGFDATTLFNVSLNAGLLPPNATATMPPEMGARIVGIVLSRCFDATDSLLLDSVRATRVIRKYKDTNRSMREEKRYLFSRVESVPRT